jgi:hypothetical protein
VIQLASVIAPGIVLVCELAYVAIVLTGPVDRELVVTAGEAAAGPGVPLVVLGALLFAGSVLIGYLAREIALTSLTSVERRTEMIGVVHLREQVVAMFDDNVISEVVRCHPALRPLAPHAAGPPARAAAPGRPATDAGQPPAGGGWGRDVEVARVFLYCKFWLRSRAPSVGVDQLELEINVLLAMLMPMLLLPVGVVVTLRGAPQVLAAGLGVVAVALVWIFILRRARHLRRVERWEAVRNLFLSHLIESAASTLPPPDPPAPRLPAARAELNHPDLPQPGRSGSGAST